MSPKIFFGNAAIYSDNTVLPRCLGNGMAEYATLKYGHVMKKLVLRTAAILTLSSQAIAGTHDISGVAIDVPLAAQRAAIVKVNPLYQIEDLKLKNGQVVGIRATVEKNHIPIDEFVVIQNKKGIVWFVSRYQALQKGDRIKPEVLAGSLKEKYGASYSYNQLLTDNPIYEFDRQGKLFIGDRSKGPCSKTQSSQVGMMISVPSSYEQSCGVMIETMSSKEKASGMIEWFTVSVANVARIYDEVKSEQDELQREKRQKIETERSKNVKPNL